MSRFIRLFLIYVLSTLSVLTVYSTSEALSLLNMGIGVADRVRRYQDFDFYYYKTEYSNVIKKDENGNIIYTDKIKKDENGNIIYKKDNNGNQIPITDGKVVRDDKDNILEYEPEYEPEYEELITPYYEHGFQCRPDKIRSIGAGMEDKINEHLNKNSSVAGFFAQVIGNSIDQISDAFAVPLICPAILKVYGATGIGGTIILSAITSIAGDEINALIEEFIVQSDYNLDPLNEMCLPITIPMVVGCIATAIASKTNFFIYVYAATVRLYGTAKLIHSIIQLHKAQKVFHNIRMCGDAWYTYGNNNLIENDNCIDAKDRISITAQCIRGNYPVKGVFPGAYKYYLDKCVNKRGDDGLKACKRLGMTYFKENNDSGLRYELNENDKVFREYKYGGMEYSYSNCSDPRPQARSFDVNLLSNGETNKDSVAKFPQLYYATGTDGINFACERFLERAEWYDAYKCCVEASNKFLCIEYINKNGDRLHKFCDKDEDCIIDTGYTATEVSEDVKSEIEIQKAVSETNMTSECACTDNQKKNYMTACEKVKEDEEVEVDCSYYQVQCCSVVNDKEESLSDDEKNKLQSCILELSKANNGNSSAEVKKEIDKSFFKRLYGSQVSLKITPSGEGKNKYCFSTQTFCPYDFNIYGGSEQIGKEFKNDHEYKYNNDKGKYEYILLKDDDCFDEGQILSCNGQPSNFCQIDRHCMMLNPYPDIVMEMPSYPYIDKSCINNVGSSHNFPGYGSYTSYYRMFDLKTHLTLPIVECIVETGKNLLFNRAGFTVCKKANEKPDDNEYCAGGYRFKKGEDVGKYGYTNFIEKIRSRLSRLVKVLLILAVIFYGFNFVVFGKAFSKEEFIKFLAKIIFVILFSLNTGWLNILFDGIFKISGSIVNIAYNVLQVDESEPSYNNNKFDGCFFGEVFNKDDNSVINNYENYPNGRKYLAFFDYIDCKFQKYMGFGVGSMNIIAIMVLFLFTGILTMVLLIPLLMIFLVLLSVVVKTAYIFIVAMLTLVLLLCFAPIMIPMILFNRTKKMFDGWVDNIIGFMFYPIFLIVSVTLLFYVYDKFFISEVFYTGKNGPYRNMICGEVCKLSNNQYVPIDGKNTAENCLALNGAVIDLMNYPVCLYKANVDVRNIGFVSYFFEELRIPILAISTIMFKFLFVNYAILFIILLFIETTIDNITNIGEAIFGAKVDKDGVKNISFVNMMSKIFGVALDISSTAINTGVGLYSKARMPNEDDKDDKDGKDNDNITIGRSKQNTENQGNEGSASDDSGIKVAKPNSSNNT